MWKWLRGPPADPWAPNTPLVKLSPKDHFRLDEAYAGTLVTGASGAGKTTSVGAALALAMLRLQAGGIVLCAKNTERALWDRYCELTGRSQDRIIIDGTAKHRINFVDAERTRSGPGGGLTENILALLMVVLEAIERNGVGAKEEQYWKRALRQLCRNLIDLLVLADREVSVPALYRLIVSAATSVEERDSKQWRETSFLFECLQAAESRATTDRKRQDCAIVADYFLLEYVRLSEKTRSVIVSTFTSLVDVLNRSLLREIFSTHSTFQMEDTYHGKIIIVDLSVMEYAEVGLIAAIILKHLFQKAVQRRDVSQHPRPVFLWADEMQYFATPATDMEFQSTARQFRVACCYLVQNLPTLYAVFGGPEGHDKVDALLGNLLTKFWCANGCPVSNEWCANTIGKTSRFLLNSNATQVGTGVSWIPGMNAGLQTSTGFSQTMDFELPPRRFLTQRRGGPENQFLVDMIAFQGGRRFAANGKCWLPVTLWQQF